MKGTRVQIFAKSPQPGLAKTRLIPALGAQGAAELALRLLKHTCVQVAQANTGQTELWVTPDHNTPFWQDLNAYFHFQLFNQQGEDLGCRLSLAAKMGLQRASRILLIGTDCPELTADRIQQAAADLDHYQNVLIPAKDGGYVLLGLTSFNERLFQEVPWSTDKVASITQERIRSLNQSLKCHDPLQDIDLPQDLKTLTLDHLAEPNPESYSRPLVIL
jgi:rSAM/selenodomain-associated transferase 1